MEEEKIVLSILVTNEQKRAIEALFGQYNWDFIEARERSDEDADDDVEESEEVPSDEETDHDLCSDCFLSPCVTTNRQSWMGNDKRVHEKNRNLRQIRYKKI